MKKFLISKFAYPAIILFIVGWWFFFLYPHSKHGAIPINPIPPALEPLQASKLLAPLSTLERNELIEALSGDTKLMIHLINDWDIDAQILEHNGVKNVKRLSEDNLLKVRLLSRLLHTDPSYSIEQNRILQPPHIVDDNGRIIKLNNRNGRYYPQTFAAATFLLAIVPPQKILAIPSQLYNFANLFSWESLTKVPNKCEECTSEKLFLLKPSLVFVSPYSHPETLNALEEKGLGLFFLKGCESLNDVYDSLQKIGYATGHALEANLLHIFMEACFLSVDNRLHAIQQFHQSSNVIRKLLYIHLDQGYSLPTNKSLTGQLFQRAVNQHQGLSCKIPSSSTDWRLPITKEKIIEEKPDFIIVSCRLNDMKVVPILPNIEAKNIFYLDETVQESPTQHIALAYFDIFQAIAAMHLP